MQLHPALTVKQVRVNVCVPQDPHVAEQDDTLPHDVHTPPEGQHDAGVVEVAVVVVVVDVVVVSGQQLIPSAEHENPPGQIPLMQAESIKNYRFIYKVIRFFILKKNEKN